MRHGVLAKHLERMGWLLPGVGEIVSNGEPGMARVFTPRGQAIVCGLTGEMALTAAFYVRVFADRRLVARAPTGQYVDFEFTDEMATAMLLDIQAGEACEHLLVEVARSLDRLGCRDNLTEFLRQRPELADLNWRLHSLLTEVPGDGQ